MAGDNPTLPYSISHRTSSTISDEHFEQCFDLIRHTSAAAYRHSSTGWSPSAKQEEMRDTAMEFLLVLSPTIPISSSFPSPVNDVLKDGEKQCSKSIKRNLVEGFLSYKLTEEDGIEVVYCYEVHLQDHLRGHGVGKDLMQMMHKAGYEAGKEKAMLTVFTSNTAAIEFYTHLGYIHYDEEQPPESVFRRLRSGLKSFKPSFIIMARDL